MRKFLNVTLAVMILNLLCLFLFAGVSFSSQQQLTDQETKIYYDYVEGEYSLDKRPTEITREDEKRISLQVAEKYNISIDAMSNILNKAFSLPISDREEQILNELDRRLKALPSNYSKAEYNAEYNRIRKEVVNKCGITLNILEDIEVRALMNY